MGVTPTPNSHTFPWSKLFHSLLTVDGAIVLGLVTEGPEGAGQETLHGSGRAQEPALGATQTWVGGCPSPAFWRACCSLDPSTLVYLPHSPLPTGWVSSPASSSLCPLSLPPSLSPRPLLQVSGALVHSEASQNKGTPGPAQGGCICQWECHHGVFPGRLPRACSYLMYVFRRCSMPLASGGGYQGAARFV